MNTRNLNNFLALAESLHFGKASDICNISVSTLSRNIRQLEEELGVSLFHRDNRAVSLTNEGETFLKYARQASTQWQLIQNELANNNKVLQGKISLYCSVTASYSILFDLLNRFRPDYPGIEIKLHTGIPELAISRIAEGYEEICIAAHPGTLPHGVIFKPLMVTPLVFITPLESPETPSHIPSHNPQTNQAWSDIPMVLSETGVARKRVDQWFRKMGITPRIYAQVEGYEAIVSMVSLGLGVGVVPKIVLDNSPLLSRIRVIEVSPALEAFDVGLFALKRSLKNPLVAAFWDAVDDVN
ncbi:HTH-type transcriptional activator IlvY [Leucothrix sargassi]|nr:HTH-type transcriptional activator IlvY [Leucothrix sargassi]